MYFHTPLKQIAAELAFHSSIIPFSKAFWDVELLNGHHLPPGPCFFYGNHSNNFDPFILNGFTEVGGSTAGVMTMEYLKEGILAGLFKASGVVGTQKRVPEPHLIRRILKMVQDGRRIVIFPEGGRRWDGRPAPWIESTAKVFMKLGIPVYPIRIHGSYVGWPRWATYPRPAHIKLEVCPAVDFSDCLTLKDGIERLKKPINFDENIVSDDIRPAWAFKPAAGITKLIYRDVESGKFGGFQESGTHLIRLSDSKKWRVQADSSLKDEITGEVTYTAEWYQALRRAPLSPVSDRPVLSHPARISFTDNGGLRCYEGFETASLWSSHISFSGGRTVPLEDVLYTGVEKNSKIWVLTKDGIVNIELHLTGSVLAWQDVLNTLIPELNC